MQGLPHRVMVVLVGMAVGGCAVGVTDALAAPEPSQFTVSGGATLGRATGTPLPSSGEQASLWANSNLAMTTIHGGGRVAVGATGDYCNGWPTIRVSVDGHPVGDTTIVDAGRYGSYPVGPALPVGNHIIRIRMINDRYLDGCDRNAHLGSVGFVGTPAPAVPSTRAPSAPIGTTAQTPAPTAAPTTTPASAPPSSTTILPTTTTAPTTTTPMTTAPTTTDSSVPTTTPTPTPPPPPVAPAPIAPPTVAPPTGVGVPAGTQLTVHEGDLVVTTKGAVIDAMDIHGLLRIEADDVTVKRSIIRGRDPGTTLESLVSNYNGNANFLIEDSTLVGPGNTGYLDGLKGYNFTALRLDISHVVDTALVYGNNVTIKDSWFHDNTHITPWPLQWDNQTHDDSLQIEGGSDITVEGNTFDGGHNSALMITQDAGRTSNLTIDDNHLSGGGCTVNIAEKGRGPITSEMTGNVFGGSRYAGCDVIGPVSSLPVMTDDIKANGQPVSVLRNG